MTNGTTPDDPLRNLVATKSVVICCGPGGVGKTTIAASLALVGARLGRRTCVVTIDPAKRLADALEVGASSNSPHDISGNWTGTLSVVALDAKVTFDELVVHYAGDPEQAQRILDNRLYRNLASALSGTQEYMATEKLHELHSGGDYDLVVVDTPPSRSALDFLEAPDRLAGFLDNKVFRALLAPGQAGLRAIGRAANLVLRSLSRIAGTEIVEDTLTFFRTFAGMEEGFRERADAVGELLASPETAYVVIGTPRPEAAVEVRYFAGELDRRGHGIDALVVNRALPDVGEPVEVPEGPGAWRDLIDNLNDLARAASAERAIIDELAGGADAPVVRVPFLDSDVHDLDGLSEVARHLAPSTVP